ncbi:Pimeloyl-ACP methyl ester carboxylesterase [Chitinophaga eiseniae]|uniref:Pimeloyl-ACP methyl ester carboxylesterase n=1 Tax=Chitinophaga eiseniae TaxID=634771 RepID=A0A1T4U2H4_9BACT|nr:alpha/beta hydrolase [Chitinophaga eiseniae]SKA46820.1 Pimeloyl-ACP methyl ester carboxylesterase [Chitinophaga eiseniae]
MRKFSILLALLLSATLLSSAQTTDSIRTSWGHLYYHLYGKGEPVLVLSGGPGNSCLQQAGVATELGKTHQAILLEQRGTGLSIPVPLDSTTINLKAAVDDVRLLLDHLRLPRVTIYGHSWGAMLAMNFAVTYPQRVKKLVLACPGYYKFDPGFFATHINNLKVRMGLSDISRYDSLEKKISARQATKADSAEYNRIIRMSYIFDKRMIDSMLKQIDVAPSNTTMQGLMIQDLNRIHYDLSKTLPRYKGPMYVIGGAQDALSFYTYELKQIHPAAILYWIQGSGHFPMFEQQKAFFETLKKTL